MKRTSLVIVTLAATCWASSALAQQVTLTLRDGRVSLHTQNASVSQILAEWERQGQVRIVGADRLAASQPLTLTLDDVSERQALDIVLRGVPGYMVVDRAEPSANASRYDRLLLLARTTTPAAPANSAATAGPAPAQPYTQQPTDQAMPVQGPDRSDTEQFEEANAEPPMPTAPVVSPYPNGAPGANGGGSNVLSSGSATVNVNPPETQFDYANPQQYFNRMRDMQNQAAQPPGQQPGQPAQATPANVYPGSTPQPASPTGTPSATGTLAQPGIAPPPPTPAQQQRIFNPYNLPPDQLQGNPGVSTTPGTTTATPVEPDRSKYANPYQPSPTRPPS